MFRGGAANLENPMVIANPRSCSVAHCIANQLLGDPHGLLASQDSLSITDFDDGGNVQSDSRATIYRCGGAWIGSLQEAFVFRFPQLGVAR